MKKISLYILVYLCGWTVMAQELSCTVKVIDRQIQTNQATERQIFREMEQAIANFMNNRKWTNDAYEPEEKINCTIEITLLKGSTTVGDYEGTAQIRASRPIYNSTYESPLFMFVDRAFSFKYIQAQPLDFNDNSWQGDLTGMLSFYAYIILGVDYDSFAKDGGTVHIEKAFNLSNIAQSSSANAAWQRGDSRNRYWLIENLMSQQMASFREGMYKYHRLAMDTFIEDNEAARGLVMEVLKDLETINRLKPSSVLLNSFLDAKVSELVGIFRKAPDQQKKEAYDILVKIDPGKTNQYSRMLKGGNDQDD